NNAGVYVPGPLYTVPTEKIHQMVDVNFTAALCLTRLCLPSMLAQGSGRIVNVASSAGRSTFPFEAVYSGTKGGLLHFSDCLRRELDGTGVEVISIVPYWTKTDMVNGAVAKYLIEDGTHIDAVETVVEGTIEAILKGQHEVIFGDPLTKLSIIL